MKGLSNVRTVLAALVVVAVAVWVIAQALIPLLPYLFIGILVVTVLLVATRRSWH